MPRVLVTSALPYANGPIHFGHVVGAYLPADIYVRHRRMAGDDVHFVCGTDEHGVAITLKAEQAGQSYQDYVDHWHGEIRRTLESVGIRFDVFSGTGAHRNPYHQALCQQMFLDLLHHGYVFDRVEQQFFSESLQRFLPDRYVEGTCYVCGFEQARGDECPKCGTWLDAKRLGNPRSTIDGLPPVLRETRHWYLDLPKIKEAWLQDWFAAKRGRWKTNVERFVEEALRDLRERPITRDLPWGVPVPLPDTQGKVLYVWFDAPIGYLSISQQYFAERGEPAEFARWWKDPATELYHFIGKDNITFHVVVFPSMLWGSREGWVLPANVPANEFFNLEGRKFNTSKGWYIPADSLAWRLPVDALRYALTTMMPETADSDWSWRELQSRINSELADNLGNFVARTLRFAERHLGGAIPAAAVDGDVLAEVDAIGAELQQAFGAFQFRRAAQLLLAAGAAANRYFDREQPWVTRKRDPPRCAQALRTCAELVRKLALLMAPILPDTSRTLLRALGLPEVPRWSDLTGARLPAGELRVPELPVLFEKIPDDAIEQELARLHAHATPTTPPAMETTPAPAPVPAPQPGTPTIEFDQFAAVDLRVGQVLSAEKHPKADRLLVLQVDLGSERRTICAGVADSYAPEELVGRKVVVVANLAPRKLRGIDSQGMLLASDSADGKARFLAPDPSTPNGTKVK